MALYHVLDGVVRLSDSFRDIGYHVAADDVEVANLAQLFGGKYRITSRGFDRSQL